MEQLGGHWRLDWKASDAGSLDMSRTVKISREGTVFCRREASCWKDLRVRHQGRVEGQEVRDILLVTGCTRTMVQVDLVVPEKILEGDAVEIQCAMVTVCILLPM